MTHTLHPSPAELAELRRNPHACGLTGCFDTAVAAAAICSGFADPAPFPICAKHLSPAAWSSDASWRLVPLADLLGGAA